MSGKMYKIRDKAGHFSKGVIQKGWGSNPFRVTFDSKGKVFPNEKSITNHLLKAAKCGLPYADWEIIEVVYIPTKPVIDWFDQKMLLKVMK